MQRLSSFASKRPWRVARFQSVSSVNPWTNSCERTASVRASTIHISTASSYNENKNQYSINCKNQEISHSFRNQFSGRQGRPLSARFFASSPDLHKESLNSPDVASSKSSTGGDNGDKKGKNKKDAMRKRHSRRFKRRKLREKERKGPVEQEIMMSNSVLRRELQNLFDEIAPLVPLNKVEKFLATLEDKHTPTERRKLVDKSTELAASKDVDDSYDAVEESPAIEKELDPRSWMQSKILSFLDILPLHARPVKTMSSPAQEHKKTLHQTAAILEKVREISVLSSDMTWSRAHHRPTKGKKNSKNIREVWHKAKSDTVLKKEAQELSRVLSERLPSHKYNIMVRFFNKYIQQKQQQQESDDGSVTGDEPSDDTAGRRRANNGGIRLLFNNVHLKLGGHIHLIAPELAKFFYFDPPSDEKGDGKNESTNRKSIAYKELKVIESEEKWQKYRERFVDKMVAIQKQIHNSPSAPNLKGSDEQNLKSLHMENIEGTSQQIQNPSNPPDEDVEEDDDDDHHVIDTDDDVRSSASTIEADEDELAEIIAASLRQDAKADKSTEKKDRGSSASSKSKRNVHLVFESVMMDEYRDRDKEYPLTSDTTVFIDNLPIDITKEEVTDLYSRCGLLESVEIFNQRPDLDPGAFSPGKLAKMAKRKRKQRARYRSPQQNGSNRWARSRTPVYAMLNFSDEESMLTASKDSLRIFGMIVRGHSVRSIRSKDQTRLYIENIGPQPSGSGLFRSAIDIELSLSRLLNPDLYVSLDISSGTHTKSKRVVPGSCEIMFPSFEVAYDSFCKLREDLDLVTEEEECTINWMRTPPDAVQYWKRELGGVV